MNETAFARDGFTLLPGVLTALQCADLAARAVPVHPTASRPGTRSLLAEPWCMNLARQLREHAALGALLGPRAVAVQCTYFEKTAAHNWLVPLHQDLSIPVAERVDQPALRGWSDKEGALFVQPPAQFLSRLVAVRLHLDDCHAEDGPLRVVPGTHRAGIVSPDGARALRDAHREVTCCAPAGAAFAMRPLLLHASSKASGTGRRRVLHFVFGPPELPLGLRWAISA